MQIVPAILNNQGAYDMYVPSRNPKVIPISNGNATGTKSKRFSRLQIWIIMLCLIWAGYTFFSVQLPNLHKLNVKEKQLNQQLADLNQKNQQLQDKIQKLNQDTYISEIARSKYNMQQPGDIPLDTP
jgi:cell division protein FtsB